MKSFLFSLLFLFTGCHSLVITNDKNNSSENTFSQPNEYRVSHIVGGSISLSNSIINNCHNDWEKIRIYRTNRDIVIEGGADWLVLSIGTGSFYAGAVGTIAGHGIFSGPYLLKSTTIEIECPVL